MHLKGDILSATATRTMINYPIMNCNCNNTRYWLIEGYNCNYNKECACNIVRERKTKKRKDERQVIQL
jgi:hypothetical protein